MARGDQRRVSVVLGLSDSFALSLLEPGRPLHEIARPAGTALGFPPVGAENVRLCLERRELALDWHLVDKKADAHALKLRALVSRAAGPGKAEARRRWGIQHLSVEDVPLPPSSAPSSSSTPESNRPAPVRPPTKRKRKAAALAKPGTDKRVRADLASALDSEEESLAASQSPYVDQRMASPVDLDHPCVTHEPSTVTVSRQYFPFTNARSPPTTEAVPPQSSRVSPSGSRAPNSDHLGFYQELDPGTSTPVYFQSISAAPSCRNMSFEELRVHDYRVMGSVIRPAPLHTASALGAASSNTFFGDTSSIGSGSSRNGRRLASAACRPTAVSAHHDSTASIGTPAASSVPLRTGNAKTERVKTAPTDTAPKRTDSLKEHEGAPPSASVVATITAASCGDDRMPPRCATPSAFASLKATYSPFGRTASFGTGGVSSFNVSSEKTTSDAVSTGTSNVLSIPVPSTIIPEQGCFGSSWTGKTSVFSPTSAQSSSSTASTPAVDPAPVIHTLSPLGSTLSHSPSSTAAHMRATPPFMPESFAADSAPTSTSGSRQLSVKREDTAGAHLQPKEESARTDAVRRPVLQDNRQPKSERTHGPGVVNYAEELKNAYVALQEAQTTRRQALSQRALADAARLKIAAELDERVAAYARVEAERSRARDELVEAKVACGRSEGERAHAHAARQRAEQALEEAQERARVALAEAKAARSRTEEARLKADSLSAQIEQANAACILAEEERAVAEHARGEEKAARQRAEEELVRIQAALQAAQTEREGQLVRSAQDREHAAARVTALESAVNEGHLRMAGERVRAEAAEDEVSKARRRVTELKDRISKEHSRKRVLEDALQSEKNAAEAAAAAADRLAQEMLESRERNHATWAAERTNYEEKMADLQSRSDVAATKSQLEHERLAQELLVARGNERKDLEDELAASRRDHDASLAEGTRLRHLTSTAEHDRDTAQAQLDAEQIRLDDIRAQLTAIRAELHAEHVRRIRAEKEGEEAAARCAHAEQATADASQRAAELERRQAADMWRRPNTTISPSRVAAAAALARVHVDAPPARAAMLPAVLELMRAIAEASADVVGYEHPR